MEIDSKPYRSGARQDFTATRNELTFELGTVDFLALVAI
jgi:hypothetical protein